MRLIKYIIVSAIFIINLFFAASALADAENPPIFYLADDHLYLKVESTEFTTAHFDKLDYLYENPPGSQYEIGIESYNGSEICEVINQDSSTTYFHCIFPQLPDHSFERLVILLYKQQGDTTHRMFFLGYETPPPPDPLDPEGLINAYSETFGYSSTLEDEDEDGFDDEIDNCIYVNNPDQADEDGDGVGDACPFGSDLEDSDGDGIPDIDDNCIDTYNPDQGDADGDGFGNECDSTPCPDQYQIVDEATGECVDHLDDSDDDGIPDEFDNCPSRSNPNQMDGDEDGFGDACDLCPYYANEEQTERVAELCDDIDIDGIPDFKDTCIGLYDPTNSSAKCLNYALMSSNLTTKGGGSCSLMATASPNMTGFLSILLGLLLIGIRRLR